VPSTAPNRPKQSVTDVATWSHQAECPLHQGKPRAPVARMDELEEGNPVEDYPEAEGQEEGPPVMQIKQENDLLEDNLYLDYLVEGDGAQDIPYEWDDELDELACKEAHL